MDLQTFADIEEVFKDIDVRYGKAPEVTKECRLLTFKTETVGILSFPRPNRAIGKAAIQRYIAGTVRNNAIFQRLTSKMDKGCNKFRT